MAQCTKDQLQAICVVGMRCIRWVALHYTLSIPVFLTTTRSGQGWPIAEAV